MKTLYRCELCGKDYEDWEKAGDCEESHVKPTVYQDWHDEATMPRYKPGKRYPDILKVRMTDDSVLEFKFAKAISYGDEEDDE